MDPPPPPATTPPENTPGNANTSGSEKRKNKRKRKRSAPSSANASGTSTPKVMINIEDGKEEEGRGGNGNGNGNGNGKKEEHSGKEGRSSGEARASGSTSTSTKDVANGQSSFADEDDFIPLGVVSSDDEDADEERGARDLKGKGKAVTGTEGSSKSKGKERATDGEDGEERDEGERDRKLSRRERARERNRKRSRSRSRSRSRDREREREWDRGKRSRREDDRERDRRHAYDYGPTNKAPWIRGLNLESCKNVAEMMHKEVEAFVKWISPTPVEDEIRGLIVKQIAVTVQSKFPDASVLPFGSYETKLYLPMGDIDLVILSESMAYSNKVSVLHTLANTLKRAGITSRVTVIAKARVPIVKFVTTHGRFNVDISINQENGLVSGNIINGFLRHLHNPTSNTPEFDANGNPKTSLALRSLVLITKAFLAQRSMNEVYTGGLGSYSIVCLAVSFLQMHPKIRRGEIDPDQNLGVLVMEFFELYGCFFNYDEVGISVRAGGTYFSKRQRGWFDYQKRGLLSIEDPADPSNDISKGSYGFQKVRTALAGAHSILTATAYLRAGIINSRRSGQSVNLRGYHDPEDLSILATVMGITQETLNHRRLVQELYDRRVLHSILNVDPAPPPSMSFSKPQSSKSNGSSAHNNSNSNSKPNGKELRIQGAAKRSTSNSKSEPIVNFIDSEEEDDYQYHHHHRSDDEEEEEGRYDIRQPPRKRQRTGKQQVDYHTVYVTSGDEDDDDLYDSDEEGVVELEEGEEKEGQGAKRRKSLGDGDRDPIVEREKQDKKRSYWLSKGIGPWLGGDVVGEDSD